MGITYQYAAQPNVSLQKHNATKRLFGYWLALSNSIARTM